LVRLVKQTKYEQKNALHIVEASQTAALQVAKAHDGHNVCDEMRVPAAGGTHVARSDGSEKTLVG
jgi:hypothetical protein